MNEDKEGTFLWLLLAHKAHDKGMGGGSFLLLLFSALYCDILSFYYWSYEAFLAFLFF